MRVITKEHVIKTVPRAWKAQYPNNVKLADGRYTDDIYKKLKADPLLTESKCLEIIGSNWTDNTCDNCKKDSEVVVVFDGYEDESNYSPQICHNCIDLAKNKIINS